ncbi:solute carrier family 39 (zinc transporter), member 7 [Sporothrix brasiliensis 5110]|uniref:Solute carrier family 39 (Zinc transporter), member 7 n=1 Tax=Sporothrix brasiliensis 5110 TaxID=1398154 RepID=A0A0C2FUT7_9PEZI|nr:solute carrier family 39 (zinc transporter), member 7 [Sporothrix brasiliensis 5110]KIH94773.1 solute carrier family 39 (zinc transporter), member 7 [Sporothrix brasiliensis 5110]
MVFRFSRPSGHGRRRFGFVFALGALAVLAFSMTASADTKAASTAIPYPISSEALNDRLQECEVVQALGQQKLRRYGGELGHGGATSSTTAKVFAVLFPGSPAVNALLATLYISGPPNFLLALCPPNIDPASLSVMVAFAVGGLLGDTLFHLLPEIFVGEDDERADRARLVLVEPNRNLLLGVAILVGFLTFVAMDKGLRIATGGDGHDHDHDHDHNHNHGSHNHDHGTPEDSATAVTTSSDVASGSAKSRGKKGGNKNNNNTNSSSSSSSSSSTEKKDGEASKAVAVPEASASVKLSGYLNLIADFTHNITDGLAMSASFYASPTIGATTTVAVFFHEIPHEVGDFALLIQSGFSKRAAMGAQFVTALGALLGTVIGILVQEFGGNSSSAAAAAAADGVVEAGLFGTSLTWGDMLLPFTAGTFLYVGTVAVIPELLETNLEGSTKLAELRKTLIQFAAIATGAGIMLYISWH